MQRLRSLVAALLVMAISLVGVGCAGGANVDVGGEGGGEGGGGIEGEVQGEVDGEGEGDY